AHLVSDLYRDLVIEPRGCAQAWRAIVGPVEADLGLLGSAHCRGENPVAAEGLHLVESGRILRPVQRGCPRNPDLLRSLPPKRLALAPVGTQSKRAQADGVLAPLPGLVAGEELNTDAGFGPLRTIVGPEREDRGGRSLPQLHSFRLGVSIPDLAEVFSELGVT